MQEVNFYVMPHQDYTEYEPSALVHIWEYKERGSTRMNRFWSCEVWGYMVHLWKHPKAIITDDRRVYRVWAVRGLLKSNRHPHDV